MTGRETEGMDRVLQLEGVERPPASLWDRILAEPDRAPEHIALAASERFGPAAAEWVRVAGAGQTPEKLARIAYRKHVRLARLEGAALGAGGWITAAPDMVALLWIESRMVFHIAAALGYDPRHPMRPAELLALIDLYRTPEDARKALDGVGTHLIQAAAEQALRSADRAGLRIRLARYLAKRTARHYAGRLIPFIGAPIAAVQNGAATKRLGSRALAYYGGTQARP
jgi:EcsC protein family